MATHLRPGEFWQIINRPVHFSEDELQSKGLCPLAVVRVPHLLLTSFSYMLDRKPRQIQPDKVHTCARTRTPLKPRVGVSDEEYLIGVAFRDTGAKEVFNHKMVNSTLFKTKESLRLTPVIHLGGRDRKVH